MKLRAEEVAWEIADRLMGVALIFAALGILGLVTVSALVLEPRKTWRRLPFLRNPL